ncbi:hypothetical protein D9613_010267 [Agrocybe pediades]|uniref:Uncharacterized protein n=1 Tax=Agrocybe pediades TaxID=84607 RepID=A0A8H4QFC8_9AGAR|nr:hypothetical protein D9613_010267 [Agrocybe pediades]
MAFAGIAISPAGDEYHVSVSLVSSSDGSVIGTGSSSVPTTISSLAKTIECHFSEIGKVKIEKYIFTLSPSLAAYRVYDVQNATKGLEETIGVRPRPTSLFGESYVVGHLVKDSSEDILFIGFVSPTEFSASFIQGTDKEGRRHWTLWHQVKVSLDDAPASPPSSREPNNLHILMQAISRRRSTEPIRKVIVNNLPSEFGAASEIESTISSEYPDVPITKITTDAVAEAAALTVYAEHTQPPPKRWRTLCPYGMILPVSIASASGSIIELVPATYRIPCNETITVTNSKDNQESAAIRFLLGNLLVADENIEREVVVFNGLKPLPKGQARITVHFEVSSWEGWRKTAKVTISQEGGPSKSYIFPRLLNGAELPDDYDDVYEVKNKKEDSDEDAHRNPEAVLGELPE